MNAHDIISALPDTHRWATALETERWSHPTYFSKMVQVGVLNGDTDLAIIKEKPGMDKHGNLHAKEGIDRCNCGCKYWALDRCIDCNSHVIRTI